jgi:hypothetical protein
MSAYAIIIGLTHEKGEPVVISGPEVPYSKQREKFKSDFMGTRSHKKYRQVQLLDSRRGVRKRKSFITPAEEKRRTAIATENQSSESSESQPTDPPSENKSENDPPPSTE